MCTHLKVADHDLDRISEEVHPADIWERLRHLRKKKKVSTLYIRRFPSRKEPCSYVTAAGKPDCQVTEQIPRLIRGEEVPSFICLR